MNIKDKIEWLQQECKELGLTLALDGECGLGRPCVGVLFVKGEYSFYPDYQVIDEDGYVIHGAEVWTPKDAYHKHPCVAVLGHRDDSVSQLYDWMKWFKDNKYFLNVVKNDLSAIEDPITKMFTDEWSACFMPQERKITMEEFLTSKEAQDVLCKAKEQLLKYPCLRFGQSLYNEMTEHYPKMEWICGTEYDMFHRSVEESYDLLYKLIRD